MPGNEFGDRVHNFFAQDSSLQGQPQPQVVEGNWPALNNNFWVGSQRRADVNLNGKHYNSQDSDIDRGQASYPFHATHGLNFTQTNLRADFGKIQPPNDQSNLNGYVYESQFHPTRQNEANFLTVDADSEQHHLINSGGFSGNELHHGSGSDHHPKTSVRSETSVPSVSFDLFGGQPQINHHQSSMLQPVQHQHSGINKMHQQQQQQQQQQHQQQHQQLMIRKMQDLQRQQQLQQLDLRQQNMINQVPTFNKQASGSHSSHLVDGNMVSGSPQYPWTTEMGTNWLNRGSLTMQGSPSGLVFPPNIGQTQHFMDLGPRQVDQSLYGVPVSSSRGSTVNQYSHKLTDRSPVLQMSTPSNALQGNHNFLQDQVGVHDGTPISRQKFENMFGHTSSQSLNNMGGLQQVSSLQRNAPQDFLGRKEVASQPEIPNEKSMRQVVSSSNEASLDPAEEKILFGSDDNIWSAFGNPPNMGGESGNLFDNGEFNSLPSIQNGSFSALMQSAVAETSSGDIGQQEEWSGLMFNNVDGASANQSSSIHNNSVKRQTSLTDDDMRMHSSLSHGSIPLSDDTSTKDVIGLNLLGHMFQNEPNQKSPNELPQRFVSMEEANKWSNYNSQHPLETERNIMKISSPWAHGQSGAQQQSNGRNTLAAAIPPGANSVLNIREAEKLSQNSHNNQLKVMQGESVHGSSSMANSCIGGSADGTSSFIQSNYILNQWKNANPYVITQGGEKMSQLQHQVSENNQGLNSLRSYDKEEVTRPELENNDMKENSNDSHRSNLSWHTSSGYKETGLSDANESKSLLQAKQKSANQLSRKVSAPRKFQYHPMGIMDEDVEPSSGLKPSHEQAVSLRNSHFDQPNFLVQFPRNSTGNEKGQSSDLQTHNKVSNEEPSHGGITGYAPNLSVPFSRHFDLRNQDMASPPGQNMLELLPKVDGSRNHGTMMALTSSACNDSTQLSEAAKYDGSVNRHQQNKSNANQGFGLHLGPPPMQRSQIADHLASSQNAQDKVNLMSDFHEAAEMGKNGQQMFPTSLGQSSCFTNGEFQTEFKDSVSSAPLPQHAGNDKMNRNFQSAFSSGSLHVNQLHEQQITRLGGKVINQHLESSVNNNASIYMPRRSTETVSHDAPGNVEKANLSKHQNVSQLTGPNHAHERGSSSTASAKDSVHASQHFSVHDISHQEGSINLLQNMGTTASPHQNNLGAPYQKAALQFSELIQPNIVESSAFAQADGDMNVYKGANASSELSSIYVGSPGIADGKEKRLKESSGHTSQSVKIDPVSNMEDTLLKVSSKTHSNRSPAIFSTQDKLEDFDQSLKPSAFSHQNYGLRNQMKGLKDSETDPSFRVSKRMKGPDNDLDIDQVASMAVQQTEHNVIVGDSLGSSNGVPIEDYRLQGFSFTAETFQLHTQCENVASQDILAHGENVPHINSSADYTSSVEAEYPQVSPQMAPSWFNQFGTFKNGQILHGCDAHEGTPSRPGKVSFSLEESLSAMGGIDAEEKETASHVCDELKETSTPGVVPFTRRKSPSAIDTINSEEKGTAVPTDACPVGSCHQASAAILVHEHLSSHESQLNATSQHLVSLSSKKRKTATSDLHPWHGEITDSSENLWVCSVAEEEWNKVTNCLPDKIEYDAEFIEDGPPLVRSKRRLILTTQFMQQLFRPPPANILSTDISSNYESVIYAVSRTVMGDACNIVSCSSGLNLPRNGMELHSSEGKPSQGKGDRCSGKVIDELMKRSMKLENDFMSLYKNSSIFDQRMECQDLDKFSVINRLAKFHGQGHSDNSMNASTQKPLPQRYVAALPMPKNLPDLVQCLPL